MVSQGNVEIALKVPVEFVNLPENVKVEGAPSYVEVKLEGAPWVVRKIGVGDVKVQVLLREFSPGERVVSLSSVRVPEGVRVVSVKPDRARIRIVLLAEKRVPVVVKWKGRMPDSYRVEPIEVKIVGKRSVVSRIKFVKTEPVDPSKSPQEVFVIVPKGVRAIPAKVRVEVE